MMFAARRAASTAEDSIVGSEESIVGSEDSIAVCVATRKVWERRKYKETHFWGRIVGKPRAMQKGVKRNRAQEVCLCVQRLKINDEEETWDAFFGEMILLLVNSGGGWRWCLVYFNSRFMRVHWWTWDRLFFECKSYVWFGDVVFLVRERSFLPVQWLLPYWSDYWYGELTAIWGAQCMSPIGIKETTSVEISGNKRLFWDFMERAPEEKRATWVRLQNGRIISKINVWWW